MLRPETAGDRVGGEGVPPDRLHRPPEMLPAKNSRDIPSRPGERIWKLVFEFLIKNRINLLLLYLQKVCILKPIDCHLYKQIYKFGSKLIYIVSVYN